MATATIISLSDPELASSSSDICVTHDGWPVHVRKDCSKLAGVVPYSRDVRCSVCGQTWDTRVAQTQHERGCRWSDGTSAHPVITYTRNGEDVAIRLT